MFLFLLVFLLICVGLSAALTSRFTPRERGVIWLSFIAHIASAFALIWLYTSYYTAGGDILAYGHQAERITPLVRRDFFEYFGYLVQEFFQQPNPLNPYFHAPMSSTGSMAAVTAMAYFFFGDSLLSACLAFAALAFVGKLGLFIVMRAELNRLVHMRALIGCMLVPSAVFWTSGVVKEGIAIFGFGVFVYGAHALLVRRQIARGALALIIAAPFVAMIKPYIFLPLGVSLGVYFALRRNLATGRFKLAFTPINLAIGAALSVGAVWAASELFPMFAVDQIAERAAALQGYSVQDAGGSTYQFGDAGATTLEAQAQFVPLALISALFRPFLFEVHNAVALINGLETAAITFLLARALYAQGLRRFLAAIIKVPILSFCVLFTLLFAVGVGLGTTNLGTLSRYRVPMMPLYVTALLALQPIAAPLRSARRPAATRRPPRGRAAP